jgi:hypothetical protein
VITVRVALPTHLRTLAKLPPGDVSVMIVAEPTIEAVLDALESDHPVLQGTIRDHGGGGRRAYMRYFACGEDLSHEPPDTRLPDEVVSGAEVFRVIGAISGGSWD